MLNDSLPKSDTKTLSKVYKFIACAAFQKRTVYWFNIADGKLTSKLSNSLKEKNSPLKS